MTASCKYSDGCHAVCLVFCSFYTDRRICVEIKYRDADMPEQMVNEKITKARTDRHMFNDVHAGQKIKDTADKVGVIGSISALLIGFLIWCRADDLPGFLIGLVLAAAGIFASFVIMSLLYSYGDMVSISIEQSVILKSLEARKTDELNKASTELLRPAEKSVSEADTAADIDQTAQAVAARDKDTEASKISNPAETKKKDPEEPLEAVFVDRTQRVAHFTEHSASGVVCPICGKLQMSDTDVCFRCSCKFVFEHEQPVGKGKTA